MESRRLVHCLLLVPRTQDPARNAVQFWPSDVRHACCSQVERHSVNTKLALSLEPVQGAVASVSLATQWARSCQKPMRIPPLPFPSLPSPSPPSLSTCRSTRKAAHVHQRRSSERNRERVNRSGVHRGSDLWRIRSGRAPAAGRPCPRTAHSTH